MRKALILLAVIIVFVLLVACVAPAPTAVSPTQAPAATSAPAATKVPEPTKGVPKGGIVKNASFGEAASLNPLLTNDTASSNYQAYLWAGLTKTDPQSLDIVGDLYETTPQLSSDGKTITWKLRKGLKWSDGKPLTSADVEFTWQKMIDPATQFPAVKFYTDSFSDVKAVDELTVQYTLKQAGFCPAIRNSGLPGPLPKHIFEKGDITQNPENTKPTVTSGVWLFKEWQKDDHFTSSPAYPNYVDGQANLDGYTFRIVKDSTVAAQLFKTQDIDFFEPSTLDWEEINKLPFAQTFHYYSIYGAWDYIGINLRNPIFQDKKVRQAITSAIDKEAMIKNIVLGLAQAQNSNIITSSWAFSDDVAKFPYNPEKAKQLLKEAGWTPGSDGVLIKDGKPFKIRLMYNAGNKRREQISIIAQDNLKAVGIQADVQAVEWTAYLDKVQKTHDLDLYVLGWSGGGDPYSTGPIWKSDGSQNDSGYANPEVDKLYEQASAVPGCQQADRKPLYAKIQQLIAEDQPYVFLFTRENLLAVNKSLKVNPLTAFGATYSPELWYLESK